MVGLNTSKITQDCIFQALQLPDLIYSRNWYEWPEEIKMYIKLFMQNSQYPLFIMVGSITAMTIAAFQSIIKTCYSYFTMFRDIKK